MRSDGDCKSLPSSTSFFNTSDLVHPESATIMPPSPIASTSAQPVLEFNGTTIFAPPPAPTYRYAISLKNDRLRIIWLEDYDSKKQCLFIAAFLFYQLYGPLQCFCEVLNIAGDGIDKIASTFSRVKDETFRLEIAVTLQVLRKSRGMTYAFVLEPISVERIDVLESKIEMDKLRLEVENKSATLQAEIQIVKAEVKKLRQESEARAALLTKILGDVRAQLKAKDIFVLAQAVATSRVGDVIRWSNSNLDGVFGEDGVIRLPLSGLYQILAVVNHHADRLPEAIQLMKGSTCVQFAYSGYTQGSFCSTSLMCVVRIDKGDQLTVKCPTEVVASTSITFTRIGDVE
ncbi:hypothetical protein PHYSODRAFT_566610 [Phytophthora sojae]|uniref:C1q domain-containing protein n=1 Tax=Phytophthora sojae (strain P6497) TaxID=1094619 RepID=G5AHN9_PHYSP|nr:hypothetical protein PHYSODRAFT_566610 [Phytophthora sojae]EGZ04960.1 hypothetical protein PHYSODRAFT_566610 [Phytophthora sojae]|eukprot:XP_009539590.1 hypothetical protein PHYSODRAFT_566610 [Phytophthora sojae]